jgi:hypothetical protein
MEILLVVSIAIFEPSGDHVGLRRLGSTDRSRRSIE